MQSRLELVVFICSYPVRKRSPSDEELQQEDELLIKSHVCYQSFVMSFGAGQNIQRQVY